MRKRKSSDQLTPSGLLALAFMALIYYIWKHPHLLIYVGLAATLVVVWYAFKTFQAANPRSLQNQQLGQPKRSFYTKVVGVTHRNPDGSSRQEIIRNCEVGERLHLVREPENPHDPSAIKVCRESGEQLGYISADVAFRMAGEIDGGDKFVAWASDLTGGSEDRPTRGVNIKIDKC